MGIMTPADTIRTIREALEFYADNSPNGALYHTPFRDIHDVAKLALVALSTLEASLKAEQPSELREIPSLTPDKDFRVKFQKEFVFISIIGEAIRLAEGKADYNDYFLYCIAPKVFNALRPYLTAPIRESGNAEHAPCVKTSGNNATENGGSIGCGEGNHAARAEEQPDETILESRIEDILDNSAWAETSRAVAKRIMYAIRPYFLTTEPLKTEQPIGLRDVTASDLNHLILLLEPVENANSRVRAALKLLRKLQPTERESGNAEQLPPAGSKDVERRYRRALEAIKFALNNSRADDEALHTIGNEVSWALSCDAAPAPATYHGTHGDLCEIRDNVFTDVLTGGNHLASALLQVADPVGIKDYEDGLQKHGQPYADMWIAWHCIMVARPYLRPVPVSLDQCAKVLYRATTGRKWSMLTKQEQREPFRISAKAVLEAAGVAYVD